MLRMAQLQRDALFKKFFPSLYSYPHLQCLLSATRELRAPTSSQEPSAHKLQHKILEGTFLASSSPSPHPISKLLTKCKTFGQWEKINNEINLLGEEMSEEKQ